MSNINKITRLINKIYHRPKPADGETSVGLDDNTNIPPKKNKKKIKLLEKRLLWCFAGIVLLSAGYLWWRMPPRMRVIAMIPRDCNHEIAKWTPLGLYRWSWLAQSNIPSKLTLYGWDGKPLWTVQGPTGISSMKREQLNFSCSSDGHVAAISLIEQNCIRVISWRDGHTLGEVSFPRGDWENESCFINSCVANSGRVWLYNYTKSYSVINAINGTDVASGRLSISDDDEDESIHNYWIFSPENDLMAVQEGENSMLITRYYFTLSVQGNKVKVKRKIIRKGAYNYSLLREGMELDMKGVLRRRTDAVVVEQPGWSSGELLDGTDNTILIMTPKAEYIQPTKTTKFRRLFNLKTGQQWDFYPSHSKVKVVHGTPDGKHVLTLERELERDNGYISKLLPIIPWPIIEYFLRYFDQNAQLILYNSPGTQSAVFPMKFIAETEYCKISGLRYDLIGQYAISPDGHQIGAIFDNSEKGSTFYYVILGW